MSKTPGNIVSFLLGAISGAISGIMFAPDKGTNTRDKLSYQLDRYRDHLNDLLNDLKEGKNLPESEAKSMGDKVITNAKDKAERLLSDVDELIGKIKNKENI